MCFVWGCASVREHGCLPLLRVCLQVPSAVCMWCGHVAGPGSHTYQSTGAQQAGLRATVAFARASEPQCKQPVTPRASIQLGWLLTPVSCHAVPCCGWFHRAWLHTCLHLLIEIQQRYVSPDTFTPPPTNLFWDPGLLQDGSELSSMYRWVGGQAHVCVHTCVNSSIAEPAQHPRVPGAGVMCA